MTNRQAGNHQGAYEPGASFTTGDLPTPDAEMLPSWLQAFGAETAQEDEQPADVAPTVAPSSPPVDLAEDVTIPAWLQGASPDSTSQAEAAQPETNVFSGPGFLSDDDLPDWLRSISTPPEMTMPDGDAGDAVHVTASSATATLPVPQVRRIWVTNQDNAEPSEGATLFAAVADTVGARPDIPAPAASANAVAPQTVAAPVAATSGVNETPVVEPGAPVPAADAKSSRTRLYLIAALVAVVLLVVIMLLGK